MIKIHYVLKEDLWDKDCSYNVTTKEYGKVIKTEKKKAIEVLKLSELKKLIQSLRTNNPYPADIFTGKTEEGKIGQYGNKVWNNCLDEMEKQLGIGC